MNYYSPTFKELFQDTFRRKWFQYFRGPILRGRPVNNLGGCLQDHATIRCGPQAGNESLIHLSTDFNYLVNFNKSPLKMPFQSNRLTSSIAVVGVGDVGAAAAYALILGNVAGEVLLVDIKESFRDGQVLDLSDATYRGNTSTHVRAGNFKEAGQCDIVVVTAGAKQKPGTPYTESYVTQPLTL
jgi:lactate/malate dehydrogenase, NAD binding domain